MELRVKTLLPLFLSPIALVLALLPFSLAQTVAVGDSFTIKCREGEREGYTYAPSLDFWGPDSDRWVTQFTGSSPRPETAIKEWAVKAEKEADLTTFIYTIKSASLSNGGQFKCNNIVDTFHNLTVVVPDLICPTLPEELNAGDHIEPICSVKKAGPAPLEIKWLLEGIELNSNQDDEKATSSADLLLEPEHNQKSIACVFDGLDGKPPSVCSFDLDVLHPVDVVKKSSTPNGDRVVTRIVLTGNPAPDADLIDVRSPDEVEIDRLENQANEDGTLSVSITSTMPRVPQILNFTYGGEILDQIELKADDAVKVGKDNDGDDEVSIQEQSNPAVAVGCVCALIILILICGVVAFYLKRKQMFPFAEKLEEGEETKKLDVEKGETPNPKEEKIPEKEEKAEEEKLTKIDNEKNDEKIPTETKASKLDDQPPNAGGEK